MCTWRGLNYHWLPVPSKRIRDLVDFLIRTQYSSWIDPHRELFNEGEFIINMNLMITCGQLHWAWWLKSHSLYDLHSLIAIYIQIACKSLNLKNRLAVGCKVFLGVCIQFTFAIYFRFSLWVGKTAVRDEEHCFSSIWISGIEIFFCWVIMKMQLHKLAITIYTINNTPVCPVYRTCHHILKNPLNITSMFFCQLVFCQNHIATVLLHRAHNHTIHTCTLYADSSLDAC